MEIATWHWHIELSSKCTLKCLRCARTEVPGVSNREIDLAFFKQQFTEQFLKEHVEKLTFCGNDGDPIYAKDLIHIIQYIKSVKPIPIILITNGSYKTTSWWENLGQNLTPDDHIHFSIDGWDNESNIKYRVNSDWDSIINGIMTVKRTSNVFLTWAAIAFSFNQDKLDLMKSIATDLQFDYFQLTKSAKFGKINPLYITKGKDSLQPADKLISNSKRFTRTTYKLSDREEYDYKISIAQDLYKKHITIHPNSKIIPQCSLGNKGLFLSADKKIYPCCWVATRYSHNSDWIQYAIDLTALEDNSTSLFELVRNQEWDKLTNSNQRECDTKCNAADYTIEYGPE